MSVLMAVRDGAAHLSETLTSLERQTFADFEVIVVDDGSIDTTPDLLDAWPDDRLVRLHNPIPLGLAGALNRGLEVACGEYVARQDADDLAHPDRLARQVTFLDAHTGIALLGSAYDVIDQDGAYLETQRQPTNDAEIRWQMLFHNAFCHSSVMLRRAQLEAFNLVYDQRLAFAQDYDLWSRLLLSGNGANLQDSLLSLRLHPSSMSGLGKPEQQKQADLIAQKCMAAHLGALPELGAVKLLRSFYYGLPESLPAGAMSALSVLLSLLKTCGPGGAKNQWAERLIRHPDVHVRQFLPSLLALAPVASLRAMLLRLLGRTTARQDRTRPVAT